MHEHNQTLATVKYSTEMTHERRKSSTARGFQNKRQRMMDTQPTSGQATIMNQNQSNLSTSRQNYQKDRKQIKNSVLDLSSLNNDSSIEQLSNTKMTNLSDYGMAA